MTESKEPEGFEELLTMKFNHEYDPEFESFINKLPVNYWARYDLSAVRLGWEMHKTISKIHIK